MSDDVTLTVDVYGNVYPAGEILWIYDTNSGGSSPWTGTGILTVPAVDDNHTVYFGTSDKYMYALNSDGTVKWRFLAEYDIRTSPSIGKYGEICFGTLGAFYVLNIDGTVKWTYVPEGGIYFPPAISTDGTIYVLCDSVNGFYLYSFNPDGTLKWDYSSDITPKSSPVIGRDGNIYFGTTNNTLYTVRPDGNLESKTTINGTVNGAIAFLSDNSICYVTQDNYLTVLNPDMTLKWNVTGYVGNPVIGANDVIYAILDEGNSSRLNSFDLNGNMLHEDMAMHCGPSSPVIGQNGIIYNAGWHGTTDAFKATNPNGYTEWSLDLDYGTFVSTINIDNRGVLYVGTITGKLYAVGTGTSGGLADSPWPNIYKDSKNTGNVQEIAVSPSRIKIMDISAGSSGTDTFDILNSGNSDLVINSIFSDNPVFTVSPTSSTIPAGGKKTITVTFAPPEDKGYTGNISITSDDVTMNVDVYGNVYPAGEVVFSLDIQGGIILSCAAIGDDGTIYIGSDENYVYAVNPDGTIKWRYQTSGQMDYPPTISNEGDIYIFSGDGYLYALDKNGSMKWKYNANSAHSPSIGLDGTIYFGNNNGYLDAVNPDGSLKWQCSIEGDVGPCPPAISKNGTIYIALGDGRIYAISPDGSSKWTIDFNDRFETSLALGSDGTLYIGGWERKVYAINNDGSTKWIYNTDGHIHQSSPVIDIDGTIYIGVDDSNLYAINPDGTLKWKSSAPWVTNSSPIIGSDGTVYIGANDGNLYAYNKSGELKWTYYVSENIAVGPPTLDSNGILYFGTKDFQSGNFNKFIAIGSGTTGGLADSPWPKFHYDARNTGSVQKFALSVGSLDFGTLHAGETREETFTILNYDENDLTVSNITCDNSAFTLSSTSETITPNSGKTVTVTFAPQTTQTEPFTGTITITTNYGTTTVSVTGAAPPPIVTLTSPNGGEHWESGTSQDITWTSWDVSQIAIEFSYDSGSTWETLAESVEASSGSYSWTIPELESSECLVRLTDVTNSGVSDVSDAIFTVSPPPSITLTSPNGGERWVVGSVHDITWISYVVEKVWIEYSLDGGSSWRTITSNADAKAGVYS